MNNEKMLTIEQVAEYLQLNYYTVYRMVASGEIPACKVRRRWRISRDDLLKYLDDQKNNK